MKIVSQLLLCLLMMTTPLSLRSLTRYSTHLDGFAALMCGDDQSFREIMDGRLVDANTSTRQSLRLDSATVTGGYRYLVRAADLHNRPGHRYRATDEIGRSKRVNPEGWGIVFDCQGDDYWTIMLSCHNTQLHDDLRDRRYAKLTLSHVTPDATSVIAEQTIEDDIDTDDHLNALCVDVHDGKLTVEAGRHELHTVMTCDLPVVHSPVRVGYVVGGGGKIAIERVVLAMDDAQTMDLFTAWDRISLDDHFAQSHDVIEGYWEYLDRETDDKHLRLGGHYLIAVVAADDGGYDIIYVDGAQVRPELWNVGMLKGRLIPTIFTGRYRAMWVDATLEPLTDEVQASIDNGVVLTIRFPIYNSQLRFSKVIGHEN